MSMTVFYAMIFASGMVVGSLKSWKLWLPVAAISGLATGIFGRMLGVS